MERALFFRIDVVASGTSERSIWVLILAITLMVEVLPTTAEALISSFSEALAASFSKSGIWLWAWLTLQIWLV
jgi:hypothetical protein